MELTRTIYGNKRYYLDENSIINQEAMLYTFQRYNDIKMAFYNVRYAEKFQKTGSLMDTAYSKWLKEKFQINAYYQAALYADINGILSSQTELKYLYIKNAKEELKNKQLKIKSLQKMLDKKKSIKASIKQYLMTGKWKKPYPLCKIVVHGKSCTLFSGKQFLVEDYERIVEADIRKLKHRIKMIQESCKRKEHKKQCLMDHEPLKVLFGSKNRYQQKDQNDVDLQKWKEDFYFQRHHTFSLPGRHDARGGNFLAKLVNGSLVVTGIDGRCFTFLNFQLARLNEEYQKLLQATGKKRKAVCYNFTLHKDKKGRKYVLVSATIPLENKYVNDSFASGCVSMDLNADHVALADLDEHGNYLSSKVIPFWLEGKTSGQVSEILGRVMAKVGGFCTERKKPLVMEDINLTLKRSGLKYGGKKRNRRISLFAYRKMTACLYNQSFKQGFSVFQVDPAYTSQMGKHLFMRKYGISIHEAAAYAIGLKGMGMLSLLLPQKQLYDLLPKGIRTRYEEEPNEAHLHGIWGKIKTTFSGIRTHLFYRELPYSILKERKRPSIASLAAEIKTWSCI